MRELENALERALVLSPPGIGGDGELGPGDFEFLSGAALDVAQELAERALAHGLSLADLENAVIASALRRHPGNKAAAARAIGLSRRAFEYRLGRQEPRAAPGPAPASVERGEQER